MSVSVRREHFPMTLNWAEKILCHIGNYLSEVVYYEVRLLIASARQCAFKLDVSKKPLSTKLNASVRSYVTNL
jgi:hypothetical protein